uniref:Uncharacterized protein n=1 Tax=Cucumis melo TaxID=3656 RepID=A0A9I9ECG7_CUCME
MSLMVTSENREMKYNQTWNLCKQRENFKGYASTISLTVTSENRLRKGGELKMKWKNNNKRSIGFVEKWETLWLPFVKLLQSMLGRELKDVVMMMGDLESGERIIDIRQRNLGNLEVRFLRILESFHDQPSDRGDRYDHLLASELTWPRTSPLACLRLEQQLAKRKFQLKQGLISKRLGKVSRIGSYLPTTR